MVPPPCKLSGAKTCCVFTCKGLYMCQTSLALHGWGLPFLLETSIKPETNNSRRLHPCRKQMEAGGCRESWPGAASGCHLLLGVCLSNVSARTALSQTWGTCSVTNRVFKRWVHVRSCAKNIPSKENSSLKLVIWGSVQFCRYSDPWHLFNQISNTWVSPGTYIWNSDSLVASTNIIEWCSFTSNSGRRSAH